MVKEIRGRSGAGSVPVHGLAPQNFSPDKHVEVCADSDEDRGSTPLASTFALRAKVSAVALAEAAERITQLLRARIQPFGPKPGSAVRISASVIVERAHEGNPVVRIRRPPVPGSRSLKHVIVVTQNLLTTNNVFQ